MHAAVVRKMSTKQHKIFSILEFWQNPVSDGCAAQKFDSNPVSDGCAAQEFDSDSTSCYQPGKAHVVHLTNFNKPGVFVKARARQTMCIGRKYKVNRRKFFMQLKKVTYKASRELWKPHPTA